MQVGAGALLRQPPARARKVRGVDADGTYGTHGTNGSHKSHESHWSHSYPWAGGCVTDRGGLHTSASRTSTMQGAAPRSPYFEMVLSEERVSRSNRSV